MSDLEARLRDAVTRRSQDYEPASDLPDRIAARVAHRRRMRRAATGTALAAAAAAVVMAVVLVLPDAERGSVRVDDGRHPATTAPPPTSVSTTTTSVPGQDAGKASEAVTRPPATPAVTPLTPLSRSGIGPVTAGMTLREAEDAARLTITPAAGDGSGACFEANLEGIDDFTVLVVEPASTGDPMDGVVRAVAGSVIPTDEGAQVGQMQDELLVALGEPTRTEAAPGPWGDSGQLLVFEAGGYAYGALVTDGMVLGLQSGDPGWVGDPEGCPG